MNKRRSVLKNRVLFGLVLAAAVICFCKVDSSAAAKTMADGTLFDAEFYYNTYADVAAVCGKNEDALYQHYKKYGRKEGRAAYAGNNTSTGGTANPFYGSAFYSGNMFYNGWLVQSVVSAPIAGNGTSGTTNSTMTTVNNSGTTTTTSTNGTTASTTTTTTNTNSTNSSGTSSNTNVTTPPYTLTEAELTYFRNKVEDHEDLSESLTKKINTYRSGESKGEVTENYVLDVIATILAQENRADGSNADVRPNGTKYTVMLDNFGLTKYKEVEFVHFVKDTDSASKAFDKAVSIGKASLLEDKAAYAGIGKSGDYWMIILLDKLEK